jgi:hypothetical protein
LKDVFQKIESGRDEEQEPAFAVITIRWLAPFRDGVREDEKWFDYWACLLLYAAGIWSLELSAAGFW